MKQKSADLKISDAALLTFLNKVIPSMEENLTENLNNNDIYEHYNKMFQDEDSELVTKQLTLIHNQQTNSNERKDEKQKNSKSTSSGNGTGGEDALSSTNGPASAVAWNSTGSIVAIGFGHTEHQGLITIINQP